MNVFILGTNFMEFIAMMYTCKIIFVTINLDMHLVNQRNILVKHKDNILRCPKKKILN